MSSSGKVYADVFVVQGTPLVVDSAQFVFQPSGVSKGNNVFTSWQSLVDEYNLWKTRIASPGYSGSRKATIVFDDTYAPISVPTLSGLLDCDIAAETFFTSIKASAGTDHGTPSMLVNIEDGVVWNIDIDPDDVARFQSQGIAWQRAAPGAATWIRTPNPAMTKFEISIQNGGLTSASSGPAYSSPPGKNLSVLLSQAVLESTGSAPPIRAAAGASVSLSAQQQSVIKKGVLSSPGAIAALSSVLDPSSQAGPQPGLTLPSNVELNGPAASSNVRPGPGMSVLSAGQLSTYGPTNIPQILQALAVGFGNNPVDGNTLSITDGTTTETFTFLLAPVNPFEVQIGGSVVATLSNLVSQINSDSVLWKSEFFDNPQANSNAAVIIRKTQSVESYPDRVYGTFGGGVNPFVTDYVQPDGAILLSYSSSTVVAIPAADPGEGYSGFSTVSPLLDGSFVTVINARNDGVYQVQNPLASGSGRWIYISSPSEGPLLVGAAGVFLANRQTRLVVATLAGGIAATVVLQSGIFPVGFPTLCIRRTDADGASTLTLLPSSGTIDGLASVPQAVTSGRIVSFDGTNWHTVGNA